MEPKDHTPQLERSHTDESLRAEREKSDRELAKTHTAITEGSDAAIVSARAKADEASQGVRDTADVKLAQSGASQGARASIHRERAHEDATLEQERAASDERLQAEREEGQRALAALLHLERMETDTRLLSERASADQGLASRDEFLGMASHDLRTLLAGIALQVDLLKRSAAKDEVGQKAVQGLDKIQRFTARMNRLIGDLVDVTSIEAGKVLVTPEARDATALVRESGEAFQPLASAQGVSLEMKTPESALMANFDHDRILQVVANLVSNAVKFTRPGGRISICLKPWEQEVHLSVTDTGSGIPAEHLSAVFERFWQARGSDRKGLGLGLYISKCIVEAHGGRIWAESQPGVGSTFTFTLPAVPASPK